MRLAKRYRVDTIPLWLRPLYWIYGYGRGFLYYLYFCLIRAACRFEYQNRLLTKVTVTFGQPLTVTAENFECVAKNIGKFL